MNVSEIKYLTLDLSNYFTIFLLIPQGKTQIADNGFYYICNGVECMPNLIGVKLNFANTQRLKLNGKIQLKLKFCKGIEYDQDGEIIPI